MMIDYSLQDVNFTVLTIYNGQQNIYKKYSSIWCLYTKAEILIDWLIDWLRRCVVQLRIVTSASYDTQTEKIKSFWHKKLSHLRNKNSTRQSG